MWENYFPPKNYFPLNSKIGKKKKKLNGASEIEVGMARLENPLGTSQRFWVTTQLPLGAYWQKLWAPGRIVLKPSFKQSYVKITF